MRHAERLRNTGTFLKDRPAVSRVVPFVFFMAFIAIEEFARLLRSWEFISFEDVDLYWLYPPKAVLTGVILVLCWKQYTEINWRELLSGVNTLVSCLCGVLVFILWINMDWSFGTTVTPHGFNPDLFDGDWTRWLMIAIRVSGAVLVVPIMEELFWRSFLLRYIIDNDFSRVPVGRFTWASFAIVAVFFGLGHGYFLAGLMAGAFFNLLLYYTKSIAQCILSHAVANLCLAGYVIATGYWHFW